MIDPLREKYWPMYWNMAKVAAAESEATRHRVGAVVVTPDGMISVGWNGTPAGLPNACETYQYVREENQHRMKTKPEVIHAERNAIDKMTRQGVSTRGSLLFVTRAPCFECCKAIHALGLAAVIVGEAHDDESGLRLLQAAGVPLIRMQDRQSP